jgi:fucose permease
MVVGLALFTIGAFILSWVTVTSGVPVYIAAILFISVGLAFFQTPNNTAVMADARPELSSPACWRSPAIWVSSLALR